MVLNNKTGTGVPRIVLKNFNEISLFIPNQKEEQTAIAKFYQTWILRLKRLSKRDKYKLLKVGLMQQLLTGRIRLKCRVKCGSGGEKNPESSYRAICLKDWVMFFLAAGRTEKIAISKRTYLASFAEAEL